MEYALFQTGLFGSSSGASSSGGSGVTTMTDAQIEMLRKQISAFTTLSERLAEMQKSIFAQHNSAGNLGFRMGAQYYPPYPYLSSAVHKIHSRQRWQPKSAQLKILEGIFERSKSTPNREKIREITGDLAQYGRISETNVYNWFQNRRARSKRKKSGQAPDIIAEPEVETIEVEPKPSSNKGKKAKQEDIQPDPESTALLDQLMFHNPEIDTGIDQLFGKVDTLSYWPYSQMEKQEMFG